MKKERKNQKITQETIFLKESEKEYIMMSDGQEIFCQHTLNSNSKSDIVFFFVQGFGSLYFTWNDFWDALHERFKVVIVDPRDKQANILKKSSECTAKRIALDIAEAIKHLNIDESKLVFWGSSIGASYIAHLLARDIVNPKLSFFMGPARKPRAPKKLLNFFFLFPAFIMNSLGKLAARFYLMGKVSDGFQKQVFHHRIKVIDTRRWKHCRKLHEYDATEDFKNINSPVYIIKIPEEKYHISYEVEIVQKLIKGSVIVDVPSYEHCHIKPGVHEVVQILERIINEEVKVE